MRASVTDAWPGICTSLEGGRVPHMYLDSLGIVTYGVGENGDTGHGPDDTLLSRPWRDGTGQLVTESIITRNYNAVKERQDLRGRWRDFAAITPLRLRDPDIDEVLWLSTGTGWAQLGRTLPELEGWPADAQLALLAMAYNLGFGFLSGWPTLTGLLKAGDFLAAAEHCHIANGTAERNHSTRILFTQAARTVFFGDDRGHLYDTAPAISAANLDAARPTRPSSTGWWVQVMLGLAGFYAGPLDALFGSQSHAGLARYGKARHIAGASTRPILIALAAETLQVSVVA